MSDIAQQESLAERLDRIEATCRSLNRQNRWLKVSVLVMPLIGLVLGAASQKRDIEAKTLTAERLVIKDAQGHKRASIQCEEKRASIELYDPTGARRITFNAYDSGIVSMYQLYPGGKATSFGWVTPGGNGEGFPSFMLRGPDGAAYASLMAKTPTSPPAFQVFDGQKDQNTVLGKLGGAAQ